MVAQELFAKFIHTDVTIGTGQTVHASADKLLAYTLYHYLYINLVWID